MSRSSLPPAQQVPNRQLRVAVVVSRFPVRSETFILRQIVGLLERGADVEILPVKAMTHEVLPVELHAYGLLARTRGLTDRGAGRLVQVRSIVADAAVVAQRSPLRLLGALLSRSLGDARARLRVLRLAARLVRHGPYDVLHCHYGPIGVAAYRASRIVAPTTPLTIAFHGYDLSRSSEVDVTAYRRLFNVADRLLPVSDRWSERLVELGAAEGRVQVLRMGVELDRWTVPERTPTHDMLRLLSIGRLVEKKGFIDAISAVALLQQRGIGVHYTIAGEGPLGLELRDEAARLGVEDAIDLVGWVSPAEALALLSEADVLLAPSVTAADGDQEGIPVAIIEAMATGLPVVATWHSGVPELVAHMETGILVSERAPPELEDAIALLAADSALRETFGMAARLRVEELHDQARLDDDLYALLASIARNPRG